MKICILANHVLTLSLFRAELIEALVDEGCDVTLALPLSSAEYDTSAFERCRLVNLTLERRGSNPFTDLKLVFACLSLLRRIKPDIVLTYTVKPNLYGGLACRLLKIPYVPNVTGLGSGMFAHGFVSRIVRFLSRIVYPGAYAVFIQNEENLSILEKLCNFRVNTCLLPGSGVNLEKFPPLNYPDKSESIIFQLVARVMKEKGIDEYLAAAEVLRTKYPDVVFRVAGMIEEEEYTDTLEDFSKRGVIEYLGFQADMLPLLTSCHCVVNPSYHEGMSNVLLEGSAAARAVIASDIPGCREIVEDGVTGFLCEPKSIDDLTKKLEQFILLSYEDKKRMGIAARAKVDREFNRKIVVEKYLQTIRKALKA